MSADIVLDVEELRAKAQSCLPQIDGELHVPGLKERVSVVRDVHGVPHIQASSLHDLWFAQGFVHAPDRSAGLWSTHVNGIIHGDLKPGNVWLAQDGTAKLGDSGLAVALDRSRLTAAGLMVGTVG